MYINRYACQIPLKLEFSRQIFKYTQISNFMKIRPVGAELFHADGRTNRGTEGQTDLTNLMVSFRNFSYAPENANKLLC
jgi:hypothetical protein